ncbi:retinitis pigmentosa GTPase regulator [Nesidiocoris tenuis]|uniref:Retinitis pigmentosa GTPase regulator n=1 Tax=Nesidiocoris tenuis TaxID=355587 RepID=A0ABN7B805_9HEMI|nr:retinitis pigmentosa GTPase regulator [Nesidiocoris tenuis]
MDETGAVVQTSVNNKYTITKSELSKWPIFRSIKKSLKISYLMVFSAIDISKHGEGLGAFVVTDDDNVYGFGLNTDEKLLGLSADDVEVPTKIDNLCCKKIFKIVVGVYQGVALSENGSVFVWNGESEPSLFDLDSPAVDIACGSDFFLILTKGSNVHLSGKISAGHSSVKNEKISLPEAVKVKSIECGEWHVALVCAVGDVYTFGDDIHSQLGYVREYYFNSDPYKAERVALPWPCRKAVCGVTSTHYLLENGEIYANGSNAKFELLGVGHENYVVHPEKVVIPEPAVDLAAVIRYNKSGKECVCLL